MLFYLVILQLDMPSFGDNHGRLAPFWAEAEIEGGKRGKEGGGNRKRKGRGNCGQDLIIKQNL